MLKTCIGDVVVSTLDIKELGGDNMHVYHKGDRYETMVFGGKFHGKRWTSNQTDAAEYMHDAACGMVRGENNE